MKNRILSFLLAVLMVVTSVPALTLFAFAEEAAEEYDYDKLYVGAEDGGSLYFAADFFDAKSTDAFTGSALFADHVNVALGGHTVSGGVVPYSVPWKVTLGTGQWSYAQGFTNASFGRETYDDEFLIYKDDESAEGVENAIIYDESDEETFHTAALATIDVAYDFDTYDYYLLEDGLCIYAVDKAGKATTGGSSSNKAPWNDDVRYIYGFTTEYIAQTNGLKTGTTSFKDGYVRLGYNGTVTSGALAAARGVTGDFTVEMIYKSFKSGSVSGQSLMADPFRNNVGHDSSGNLRFSMSTYQATTKTVDEEKKEITVTANGTKSILSNTTVSGIKTNETVDFTLSVAKKSDGYTYVGSNLYAGLLDVDVFANGTLVDKVTDDNGVHHTVMDAPVYALSGNSLFKIGEGDDFGVYAIRVYTKALTAAETNQNHFADLAKFYKIDMLDYDSLSDARKADIHTALRDYKLTETTDTATADTVKAAYLAAYIEANKTGNEHYDAFIEVVINNNYDLSAFNLLSKADREAVVVGLSGTSFTQDDLDAAVAEAGEKVNATTEEQYNSLYVQDGALLLSDFFSAKEGAYLTSGGTSSSNITYDGYYGRYKTDENGDYVLDDDGNKIVEWIEAEEYTGVTAATKYNGTSSNYAPYVHTVNTFKNSNNSVRTPNLSGGTLPLGSDLFVTKMSNTATLNIGATTYKATTTIGDYDYYMYEKADDLGEISVYTLRVPTGFDLSKRDFEQYVVSTGDISDTYLQANGNFAYTSSFHDGYFSNGYVSGVLLGELSTFVTTGAQASAASGGEEHVKYSIQVVFSNDLDRWQSASGSAIAMFGPPRTTIDNISASNSNLKVGVSPNRATASTNNKTVYLDISADAITDFTFSYDSSFTKFATADGNGDTEGTMDMDIFVNGKLIDLTNATSNSSAVYYDDSVADQNRTLSLSLNQTNKTTDGNYKFGENGAANIYAIRFYGKTLTTAEIRQNHFADVVKYNEVDISTFFDLSESQKQEVYAIFADVVLDEKTTAELQAMYDAKYSELYYGDLKEEGNDSHNHVIDLAEYYSLDLSVYNALPDSAKAELYKKTDEQTLDDSIFNSDMQTAFDAWIDEAVDTLISGDTPTEPTDPYSLYVADGIMYHINFLRAGGNGEALYSSTDTTNALKRAALDKYAVGELDASTDARNKNDYFLPEGGSPLVYDNYIKLYSVNDDGSYNYYPLQYQGESYLETTDYTMQFVSSYDADSVKNFSWWIVDFRFSVKTSSGNVSYVNTDSITRWGFKGWTEVNMSSSIFSLKRTKNEDGTYTSTGSYNKIDDAGFNIAEAQTYTVVADRTINDSTTKYIYHPAEYNEAGKTFGTTFEDSYYVVADGETRTINKTLSSLPALTYEQKQAIVDAGHAVTDSEGNITAYKRISTDQLDGAEVICGGVTDGKFYVNDRLTSMVAEQPFTDSYHDTPVGRSQQSALLNLYAIRIYDKTLTVDEIQQNNFADLAVMFDIELDIFELLTDTQKQTVYDDMASYNVTDEKNEVIAAYNESIDKLYYTSTADEPTDAELHFYEVAAYYRLNLTEFKSLGRTVQLTICDEFQDVAMSDEVKANIVALRLKETIRMQSSENFADYYAPMLVTFEGYAVRKSTYPGLRSVYFINKEILSSLEEKGYTVTIGAMMGLATDPDTGAVRTYEDLAVAETDGEYAITTTRSAFVEVYNGGFKKAYWDENSEKYGMAFTTVYEQESSQTVERYNAELIYSAYVVLEKDGEEDKLFYVDTSSQKFGDSMSLYEVSKEEKTNYGHAYSMVQKVLNAVDGTSYSCGNIAGYELSDFEFVYAPEDEVFATSLISELNAIIEEKTGVELKSATTETHKAPCAIYICEDDTLTDANYGVYVKSGDLYITYDYAANAYYAMQIAKSLFDVDGDISIAYNYSEMGSVPTYKVVFLGDSNTHGGYVFQAIDTYLQTQYPNVSIEVINAGTSGGSASGAVNNTSFKNALTSTVYDFTSRFEREVLAENPDAMVISFGINDLQYSGVKTNKGKLQIDRIWDATNNKEITAESLFVDGEFIGIDAMKEQYAGAFTAKGRVNFKTVTYSSLDEFNTAIKDTEYAAKVKFAVDSNLAEDMTDTNVTEFESMMAAYRKIIDQCLDAGIEVIIGTPVDYIETNTTTDAERCIGVKYTFELLVEYAQNVLAEMDGVTVVDYYTPQIEAKSTGASLMNDDMKHFRFGAAEARGPYILANAFMSDIIGADSLIAEFARDNAFTASVIADGVDGVTFSYKPTGISMAAVDYIASTVAYSNVLSEARELVSDKENYNKEIIKVSGLDVAATYSITIDGVTLATTYTGASLAEGVDISLDANNPYARIANEVAKLLADKRVNCSTIRGLSYVHENALIGLLGGHLATDEGVTREEVAEHIETIISDTVTFESSYLRSCANSFMATYDSLDDVYSQIDLANYKVKQLLDLADSEIVIARAD